MKNTVLKSAATLALLLPSLAMAHPGHPGIEVSQGLLAGALHPLMGLDHLLAFVALGILMAKTSLKQAMGIGALFVGLLAVGFFGAQMGVMDVASGTIETMILLSAGLSVGLVALFKVVKGNVSALALTGFAVFHGFAHGLEVPLGASTQGFAMGFLVSALALMVVARTLTMTGLVVLPKLKASH